MSSCEAAARSACGPRRNSPGSYRKGAGRSRAQQVKMSLQYHPVQNPLRLGRRGGRRPGWVLPSSTLKRSRHDATRHDWFRPDGWQYGAPPHALRVEGSADMPVWCLIPIRDPSTERADRMLRVIPQCHHDGENVLSDAPGPLAWDQLKTFRDARPGLARRSKTGLRERASGRRTSQSE